MSNFTHLDDLPKYDLFTELNSLLKNKIINWNEDEQICINTIPAEPNNYKLGTGSLKYDWNYDNIKDEYGYATAVVKEKSKKLAEGDFSIICSQFKNTLFEVVFNELSKKYTLGRLRLMKSSSKTCLSWHTDSSIRIHYPVKTQEGCLMIIDSEVKHLPINTWWMTNTKLKHTAMNASLEDRIHLVGVILNEY